MAIIQDIFKSSKLNDYYKGSKEKTIVELLFEATLTNDFTLKVVRDGGTYTPTPIKATNFDVEPKARDWSTVNNI